ncbi:SOS response-associated peptidase [Primorskyibacter sp. S87]|uniref:SOS response-associated peptidase n=1 Tax=Primorskyibacter sp. S87 TaxID=3415126 RepID=UPI003C79CF79
MPGRLFLTESLSAAAAELGPALGDLAPDSPRFNIQPGQEVCALSPRGWQRMRWGLIPVGRVNARGRPVMETIINARSETLFGKSAFSGTGRAVLPVNGWYEWTGKARAKTAWRLSPKAGGFLYFACITDKWIAPGGQEVLQLATVTCPPNADVDRVHHRMGVLLHPEDVPLWLTGIPETVSSLMVPWPDGLLDIELAKGVDWSGP